MSKKDRCKSEIDILKTCLLTILSAIFGIFAYCVIHYHQINLLQSVSIGVGLLILFVFLFFVVKRIIKNLKDIEDFE